MTLQMGSSQHRRFPGLSSFRSPPHASVTNSGRHQAKSDCLLPVVALLDLQSSPPLMLCVIEADCETLAEAYAEP
ncbi:MAG: hypothetical protein K0R44_587 [Thermomicrobiales bacterium]|jgi:hypothetical protein|nr:hypothetical protein [Thermomicrobiales bacterium]